MTTIEIAVIAVAAVIVLALLLTVARRSRSSHHLNTLNEVDSFARARNLTTQWANRPETSPQHVTEAPDDARALGDEQERTQP